MALIGFLFGSIIGLFGATTGWLLFGLSLTTAISLYFAIAFAVVALPLLACALRTYMAPLMLMARAAR